VAETLTCPRCGVTCSVERDPVTIDYSYGEWRKQCVHANVDGLTACPEMLPKLRHIFPGPPRQ
jgi:hypothetical protein